MAEFVFKNLWNGESHNVLPDILFCAKTDHLNPIGLDVSSTLVICMEFSFTLFDSALMVCLEWHIKEEHTNESVLIRNAPKTWYKTPAIFYFY